MIHVSIEDDTGPVESADVDAPDYGAALMTDEVGGLITAHLAGRDEGNVTIRIFSTL